MKKILSIVGLLFLLSTAVQAQKLQFQGGKVYSNDQLFTGKDSVFFDNEHSQLKAITSYRKGLKEGIEYYYFGSGEKKAERAWKRGKKEGTWTNWNANGKRIAIATYKKGRKHGCWKVWHNNGQLLYVMYYQKGKKTGHWKQWDSQGKLIMEKLY